MSSSCPNACCASDGFCRLVAERSRSLKAEHRTGLIAGFDDAVGEQGDLLARRELERAFGVGCVSGQAQRQPFSSGSSLPATYGAMCPALAIVRFPSASLWRARQVVSPSLLRASMH
jgi:hypothetical protein